jgi:phosphotransferase system HPr-like phosphotransfer protein
MTSRSVMVVNQLGMHARARGTSITITATGRDEAEAIAALSALVQSGFGEDVCST